MTTNHVRYTWHPSGARITTAVSSLELKNSNGSFIEITGLESPILIRLINERKLTNNSQSYFIGANRMVYHKINVTSPGMAMLIKVLPENKRTKFFIFVNYQERPTAVKSDFKTSLPDFSSCTRKSSNYVNCSREPFVVFVDSAHINRTGLHFVGIQVESNTTAKSSREKRCVGKNHRSKRSCVEYKEPPTRDSSVEGRTSVHKPQYNKGDENYTMQIIPAACLYWNSKEWTNEGCKVAYFLY